MADRAKQHGIELRKLFLGVSGQSLPGGEVVLAAPVEIFFVGGESELFAGGVENLDRFGDDFRPGTVAGQHCDFVIFRHDNS